LFRDDISGGDYFKAFAYSLGSGLSNKHFGIPKGDPDKIEYL
jgi:hypothetical protein